MHPSRYRNTRRRGGESGDGSRDGYADGEDDIDVADELGSKDDTDIILPVGRDL